MDPASFRPDRLERDLLDVNTIRAAYPDLDSQTASWRDGHDATVAGPGGHAGHEFC
jgi:hypothetical protein